MEVALICVAAGTALGLSVAPLGRWWADRGRCTRTLFGARCVRRSGHPGAHACRENHLGIQE